mmetsp:Transcript_62634/g.164269  ORF Transcript_62634/g.164269 Transcript_62634/m.164269 type:complete len:223 (+) Transcript_62634:375-1043(+)
MLRALRRQSCAPVIVEGRRMRPTSPRLCTNDATAVASQRETSWAHRACHCSSRHLVSSCTTSASASFSTQRSSSTTTFISRCHLGSMKASILTFSGSYFFMMLPPVPVFWLKALNFSWPCRASWRLECKLRPRPSTFEKPSAEPPEAAAAVLSARSALAASRRARSPARPERIMPTCCREFSVCSTSGGDGDSVVTTTVRCSLSVKLVCRRWVKRELRKGMC